MPLQINDPNFGDEDYYNKRRKMLKSLNKTADTAYLKHPDYYADNHGAVVNTVNQIKEQYPEQFADLQQQNTDAKIRALNEIDLMDSETKHAGNPVARLGSQGASTQLRMPMAWADQHPTVGEGRARGFYTPSQDRLVIPMHTMLGSAGGPNTVTHETMHRGFSRLGEPASSDKAEHNYIYHKMLSDYNDPNSFTKDEINKYYETRPGFRYEPRPVQDKYNQEQALYFEELAKRAMDSK